MKTKEQTIQFSKEQVQAYVHLLGDQNPVYSSVEKAKALGLLTIPIPPAMPMIIYPQFELPWVRQGEVILRKQYFQELKKLYIDEPYTSFIALSDSKKRKRHTFSTETLYLYDAGGQLCFQAVSELLSGDVI